MSEPAVTATVEEAVGLRTHPLTGLVQGVLWAAAAVVGLFGSIFFGDGLGGLNPWLSLLAGIVGGLVLGIGAGFASWWFTRYVIDGTELRINRGIVTKSARRIPYERIQSVDIAEPLVARLLGLAELRIEMAGGRESRTSLRYLSLDDTRRLRTVLLDKAHGIETQDDVAGTDDQRSVITTVPPGRIMVGTLLSLDFLFAAVGSVGLLVTAIWFGRVVALLGGVLPLAWWLVQIVGSRVIQQWDFTLSRGPRGLRIERGLLSRTSQTIPFDRVQGIAIKEPFVWRRLGWQRLEVDVAGYAAQDSDDNGSQTSSTLLPISDPALAEAIINELIPGTPPAEMARTSVTRRSLPFAPIGWRYRWIGADDRTFVAQEGWIQRTTSIVPHHKTQSVELRQGPVQRLRRVATVEVHTPKGPVDADGRNLDAADARAAMLMQLVHARASRRPPAGSAVTDGVLDERRRGPHRHDDVADRAADRSGVASLHDE